MTTPSERTRALRWAGELLSEMQNSPDIPDGFRQQAERILRHYPSTNDIQHWAAETQESDLWMAWLGPEKDI